MLGGFWKEGASRKAFQPDNSIFVCKKPGMRFNTIKAALDSIKDASPTKRYVVFVQPGFYTEQNPLTVPDYVTLAAMGNDETNRIIFANSAQHGLVVGSDGGVEGFQLEGASGSGKAAVHVPAGVEDVEVFRCSFRNNDIAILNESTGEEISAKHVRITGGTQTTGIKSTGEMTIMDYSVAEDATVTDAILVDGASAAVKVWNIDVEGALTTTALHIDNGAGVEIAGAHFHGCTNGVRIGSGSGTLTGFGAHIENSGTWDMLIEAAGARADLTGSRLDETKLSLTDPANNLIAAFVSTTTNDEGFSVVGELHVGRPGAGKETVLGEGDSHTIGMAVQTNTNLEAGSWVDETADAASASGSTYTAFPGVGVGNTLYIGGDSVFPGLKLKMGSTALAIGSGALVWEYWDGTVGGGSWVEFHFMASEADKPYTQHAEDTFTRTSASDQIRFPTALTTTGGNYDWDTKSLNGVSKYWIRIRVATGITTAPVIEQTKLHTNRFECNANGFNELFGEGRQTIDIMFHRNVLDSIVGSSPASQDIEISSGITLAAASNRFADNATDAVGGIIEIPPGLDTSDPLTLQIQWAPSGTGTVAGDVELEITYAQVKEGDVLDGTITETSEAQIVSVNHTAHTLFISQFEIPVDQVVPGEFLALKLFRDASVGNGDDTLGEHIYIVNLAVVGTQWHG